MPGFSDVLGNDMIKEYFERTLANGQISHAYILTGEAGMGRKTLAKVCARKRGRTPAGNAIPAYSFCRTTIRK